MLKQKIVFFLCLFTLLTYRPAYAENWIYVMSTDNNHLHYDSEYTVLIDDKLICAVRYEVINPKSNLKYIEEYYKVELNTLTGETFMSNLYDKNHNLIKSNRTSESFQCTNTSPVSSVFRSAIERYNRLGR